MAMTTDRDDPSLRRYRQANDALDERPSASTRAAILAAAARHVEAGPQAADAARPAVRRRWPLAAAAAVLLSTLAVMLATRTEQEMPTFTAPAERVQESAPATPSRGLTPPQRTGAADAGMAPPPPGAPALSGPDASAERAVPAEPRLRKSAPPAPTSAEAGRNGATVTIGPAELQRSKTEDAVPQGAPARAADGAGAEEAKRALPAAAPPRLEAPSLAAPEPAAAPGVAAGVGAASRSNEAMSPAPSVQGALRQDSATKEVELSAQRWLERIVKLRGEGRHAEADIELKRFRERYPEARIPPAALPPGGAPAGTR
jgi:hypothetical protein